MRILMISLFLSFAFNGWTQGINTLDAFFQQADRFFKNYVEDGMVDYKGLKAEPNDLTALIHFMEKADLSEKPAEVKKAFWINAYNLTTIKSVVFKYPIDSPLDDPEFFTGEKHKVANEMITLNDIEKKRLMATYQDERIHFVLVCAAMGCPKLAAFAYQPDNLELQLEKRTKTVLNDDDFIKVKDAQNKVDVSEIFKWYRDDFKTGKGIIGYINQYREEKIPANYGFSYYTYDWSLNEKKT